MPGTSFASSAVLADEAWRPLIASARTETRSAAITTAFARAVNLEFGGAQFTLLAAGDRPAPGALITGHSDFSEVRAGDRVVIRADGIEIGVRGGPAVDLRGIDYFDSRAEPLADRDAFGAGEPPCSIDPLDQRARLDPRSVAGLLAETARPGSFVAAEGAPPFERAVGARLAVARSIFRFALAAEIREAAPSEARSAARPPGASPELRRAVAGLVGLGIGLTPSGDDYLVGTLVALSVHPAAEAARGAVAVAVRALLEPVDGRDRTTAVSRHFLLAACEREFHSDLAAAARAVLLGDPAALAAFAAAAAIGSTSGTDALFGLVDAYTELETPGEGRACAHDGSAEPVILRAGSPALDSEGGTP